MDHPEPPSAAAARERIRIYQLLPRLFGNVNETRKPGGTIAENGCGKFADIDERALAAIRAMHFTHVWLTGVLQQATATGYPEIGAPADDPVLLKGLAGSPYAIKDCFDVCPDYALDPRDRLAEFRALLDRIHAAGMRSIIDFVPNHVARSHRSDVRPELTFGDADDRAVFFDPRNNFYWLQPDSPGGGPPLKLPPNGARHEGESDCGRVTGNNAATWSPAITDWYETVKLNYGYDFTTGLRAFPHASSPDLPIPDTWWKMDAILAHWQAFGVDGFRCDMSHMVPSEFWAWAIARARERQPAVLFIGEAYDADPMKIGDGFVMHNLLNAGFDAVYDDPSYKALKRIYDGPAWANDLDGALAADHRPLMFSRALRYAENHDEVRLAGAGQWGGAGMNVGRPVSAILFGVSRGPVLLYSGQEVGEPAAGAEGFGGDDARTTIFDYWCMPELAKWVNAHAFDGGRLSPEQRGLRAYYARLLALVGEPAFRDGDFHPLNPANVWNPGFGRLPGEPASGHWLYAFIRHEPAGGQRFLIVANLHPRETLRDVCVQIPEALTRTLRLDAATHFTERLNVPESAEAAASLRSLRNGESSITVRAIPPLAAFYFELHHAPQ